MASQNLPVCVVEDNNSIRKLFCALLNKGGFATVEFANGQTALDWLQTNEAQLVIVDILLPDINGTEILQSVRRLKHGEKMPLVAITGFAHANDREKYLNMGFNDYIAKPINVPTFVEQVKQIINK
ncbi:MAG: response regulator [Bacteroidota bacterium]|jgi:DNA-binding response OmpR family regulator